MNTAEITIRPAHTHGTQAAVVRCALCRERRRFYDASIVQAACYLLEESWHHTLRRGWICPACYKEKP